jgi:alpha-1,3-glucan synthase
MSPFVAAGDGRMWMQNIATGFYAFASSSGSIFFALNFGDEGETHFHRLIRWHNSHFTL